MRVGMIGLGRMGANMARRLAEGGHEVVGFDPSAEARAALSEPRLETADSLEALCARLAAPRVVWMMVPAGEATDATIQTLSTVLAAGDLVIDGGNSRYTDSQRHGRELGDVGIAFLDCGTSGGVWGLREGYCLMIGGAREAFTRAQPLFATLAPNDGYLHTGPVGSGHLVKMIHNGIEYGLMEAYAEGFGLMAAHELDLDLAAIADLWQHGSVIRSWLLELGTTALQRDARLSGIQGYVEDSGEGRWTVEEAIRLSIPTPALAFALFERFRSRQNDAWADRFIAALRREFGGHAVRAKAE